MLHAHQPHAAVADNLSLPGINRIRVIHWLPRNYGNVNKLCNYPAHGGVRLLGIASPTLFIQLQANYICGILSSSSPTIADCAYYKSVKKLYRDQLVLFNS